MFVVYILIVAAGIGLLILAHELGHFAAAKLCNVRVEAFSIGFGPEIAGVTRGETRYSLRALPLGGYVKMMGDEPGSDAAADERSFLSQGFARKSFIIVAGAGVNIVLSLVLFVGAFQIGVEFPAARVGAVAFGSAAYYGGLETGDRIVEVNGQRDIDYVDLLTTVVLADPGQEMLFLVERGGERLEKRLRPRFSAEVGRSTIGIAQYMSLEIEALADVPYLLPAEGEEGAVEDGEEKKPEIVEVTSSAREAGVPEGWTIKAVNGEDVADWFDFERRLTVNGLAPYRLTVLKGEQEKTFEVKPKRSPSPTIGFNPVITTQIVEVEKGSLAEEMGFEAGDRIVALGETAVDDAARLNEEMNVRLGELPPLGILRDGKTLEVPWPEQPASSIDFLYAFEMKPLTKVAFVIPGTPADVMGLEAGDEITAVDGQGVTDFAQVPELLRKSTEDSIAVAWSRDGEVYEGSFEPFVMDIVAAPEMFERKQGLAGSCRIGLRKAWGFATQIYLIIRKALGGQASVAKNLGGPVSIARLSYQVARYSIPRFIFFLGVISINLGILNLLPIPILDGGLLAVFLVEKIKGSPLAVGTQAVIQYVGLAIIVALFVLVTFQDIMRLFS